jgi:hypothetical protein
MKESSGLIRALRNLTETAGQGVDQVEVGTYFGEIAGFRMIKDGKKKGLSYAEDPCCR